MSATDWPVTVATPEVKIARMPDWAAHRPKGAKGEVAVAVLLSLDSRVIGCNILHGSGTRALDDATCAAARMGRYVTQEARPPVDRYILPMIVRWDGRGAAAQLPSQQMATRARLTNPGALDFEGLLPPVEIHGLVLALVDTDQKGKPVGCRIEGGAGPVEDNARLCKWIIDRAQFNPLIDVFGVPRASTATMRFRFTN
jgi:hypothetical protein